jgi:hypothetical protein
LQFLLCDIRLVTLHCRYKIILPEIFCDQFQLVGEFLSTPFRFALLVGFGRLRDSLNK